MKCGVPSPMNGGLSPDPSKNGLRLEFYGAFFFVNDLFFLGDILLSILSNADEKLRFLNLACQ